MRNYQKALAAGVVSIGALTAWDSSAGDVRQCPVDRPCFNGAYQECRTVQFEFTGVQGWDYYNVRYRTASGGVAQVENETGRFSITNARPNSTYTISVQGCDRRFLASSKCSPWVEESVSTVGDFGPDTCRAGFVWREASPSDHVCVRPEVRAQVAADNAQAASRRQPGGGPWGPNTCMSPYVWREAFPGDGVCVDVAVREQMRRLNQEPNANRVCQ